MFEHWRLIRTAPFSGGLNMALDEALLEAVIRGVSPPVLRLYRWAPPALTLGYAQRIEGRVDLDACRKKGVEVIRRATGGRAVLHDNEVTYAVVAPVFSGGVLDNYGKIAEILLQLLRSLGVEAEMAPGRGRSGDGGNAVCFTAPSSCELVFKGCKMAGSAQRRAGGAFLQHGSIPVEMDIDLLASLLDPVREPGWAALLQSIGWLNRFLPSPVTVEEVEERLVRCFSEGLGIVFRESPVTSEEWSRATVLHAEKYPNLAEKLTAD